MTDGSESAVLKRAADARGRDPEEAIVLLKKLLQANPTAIRPKLLLAAIFADEYGDDVAGAERLYREVRATLPENIPALSGLALLQGRFGSTVSLDESVRLLSLAAEVSGHPDIISDLAYKLWDSGLLEEARQAFTRLQTGAYARGNRLLARDAEKALKLVRRGERGWAPALVGGGKLRKPTEVP